MTARTLPTIAAIVSIFGINAATCWLVSPWSAADVVSSILLSVLAALIAMRVWQRADCETKGAPWWLLVAVVSALFGLGLWLVDIHLGYIVFPILKDHSMWDAITNPYAVMVSAAFFPLFTAVATATAIRVALQRKFASEARG